MHKWRAILGLWLACRVITYAAEQEPIQFQIEGAEYELNTGRFVATNGIVVKYGETTLTARRASLDQQSGEVEASGQVRLERQGQSFQGEEMAYNFKTGHVRGERYRTGQPPVFASGDLLLGDTKAGVYVGSNARLTTDDSDRPGYVVRARYMIIVPGEYVEAKHAVLYLKGVPVFYFPYYRRSLREMANHWTFTPGYKSADGPFLLTAYNWFWGQQLEGAIHIDGRLKRGIGVGPDVRWNLPRYGEGMFRGYYINDLEPGEDIFTEEPLDEDRGRVWFGHQVTLRTNLTAKALVRYQSDRNVLRDFFEGQYRNNVQPNSFVELNQAWSNWSLDALVQPQVNEFFETVERLPDVRLSGLRQQIGESPFYYESESSVGYYRRKFGDETNAPYAAMRADSFHQVTLPWTFFNWLNVTPRAGVRGTHYGEAHLEGGATDEENRGVFNTGAEVSFKASRVWAGARNKFFQVDGLRHIVQPSFNYAFVPDPSVAVRELPQFDYTLPTTRLLPIDFPDFNAIDAIDAQNVVRLGLRNKLQTKRKYGVENIINWALYTDLRIDPNETQEQFSDVYSDMDFKPFHWMTLTSETRYDVNEGRLKEANHILTLSPNPTWSWRVGHRYLENLPGLGPESGNNTFFHSLYYKFSENWASRVTHHFEARDGTLEEQQYTIYRDLRSWTSALTFRVRERRGSSTDFTVAVTVSLKAFPRYGLRDDVNYSSLLLGY